MNPKQRSAIIAGAVIALSLFMFPTWVWEEALPDATVDGGLWQRCYAFRYLPAPPHPDAVIDDRFVGFCLACILITTLVATLRLADTPTMARKHTASRKYALSELANLITMLRQRNRNTRIEARAGLTDVLTGVKATDNVSLTPAQWEILYAEMGRCHYRRDSDFLIAALQALEQVGNESAIPCVHYLSDSDNEALRQTGIQAQAQHCLRALRERTEIEHAARALLRPSFSPDVPEATLLRPANDTGPTDTTRLVRPIDV